MTRSVGLASIFLLGIGCGDNRAQAPDAAMPDARGPETPDAKAPDAPFVVTVHTGAPPALVAMRDEASTTWQTFDTAGKAEFPFEVSGPYRVVVVCSGARTTTATQIARTLADGHDVSRPCNPPTNRPFFLRGEVEELAFVAAASGGIGKSQVPWMLELAVPAGTLDVAVLFGEFSRPDRIALRRDVVVAADVDLGKIGANSWHAEALIPRTFTPTNKLPGEVLRQSTNLETPSGVVGIQDTLFSADGGWDTGLVPADLLRATDLQRITLGSEARIEGETGQTLYRVVSREIRDGDPTDVTLPAPVGPVALELGTERFSAQLPAFPADGEVTLSQTALSDDFRRSWTHELRLSHSFVAATGTATAVVDFRDVPGFREDWRLDPGLARFVDFNVSRELSPRESTSAGMIVELSLPEAPPELRARARAVRRALAAHRPLEGIGARR